jgi:rhodanese-related sulfurtransferase
MATAIPPDELKRLLEAQAVTLLDVRRKADREADPRRIPGADWQDPEQVEVWARRLSGEKRVVAYCVKGGSVSQSITEALTRKNLNACYLQGGLKAWEESGGVLR